MRKKKDVCICGFKSVYSFCIHKKDRLKRLYFSREHAKDFGDVCRYLASKRLFYKMIEDEKELFNISKSIHNQGAVAIVEEEDFPFVDGSIVNGWVQNAEDVLFTDCVGNSQNLGAIIRSMAFFGFENLVIPVSCEQSYISPSTYRVAEGGMSFVNIFLCGSSKELINIVKGKMKIITTSVSSHHDITKMPRFIEKEDAILLVMGNEISGVSVYVKKQSDHLFKVSGVGNIESLNVAQCATLFLQKLKEIKCV